MRFSAKTVTFVVANALLASVRTAPLVCYEDNPLRALRNSPSQASAFCPAYLAGTGTAPSFMSNFPATRVSSACQCFQSTAAPNAPVTTLKPVTTPTSVKAPASTPKPTSATPSAPVASTKSSTTVAPTTTKIPGNTLPVTPSSGKAKRGLVYNYKSKDWSKYFVGSKYISFGSDWSDTVNGTGGTLDGSFTFIPTLTVDGNLQNAGWSSAVTGLINRGTKVIFSSNEPDNAGQANLTPQRAATAYKTHMQPFAGKATLCTPAITNGGGATGLAWLENFVKACTGCRFDAINIHHYVQRSAVDVPTAVKILKSYIDTSVPNLQAKYPQQLGGLKFYIGEFWLWGASDAEGAEYLKQIMPYLDANDRVAGYQAFGGLWQGNFINSAGNGLTAAGETYRNYGA